MTMTGPFIPKLYTITFKSFTPPWIDPTSRVSKRNRPLRCRSRKTKVMIRRWTRFFSEKWRLRQIIEANSVKGDR